MINTRTIIGGSEYFDYQTLQVNKSTGDVFQNSDFQVVFDSPYGRHANDFLVGTETKIYAGPGILGNTLSHYRFNEGTGLSVRDEYDAGSGVLTNNPSWGNGILGSSIQLNGSNSYVFINNIGSTAGSQYTNYSVSAWVNLNVLKTNINNGGNAIVYGSPVNYGLAISSGGFLQHFDNSSWQLTAGSIVPGSWYHVIHTKDGTAGSLFINSVASASFTDNANLDKVISLGIRMDNINNTYSLSGLIDDVRFFNKSLSQSEITQLYNGGSGTIDFKIFDGIIDTVRPQGKELSQTITLTGRDYGARLVDTTIQPVVYTNTEVGSIIRNFMNANVQDVTYNNVSGTSLTLPRIKYNHKPAFDALSDLAKLTGYIFYVDDFKDLHFNPRQIVDTNLTLGSLNTTFTHFDTTRQGMANRIFVYGDRQQIDAPRLNFQVGSPVGGSVFTLTYSPTITQVATSLTAGSFLNGGILSQTTTTVSGVGYLVDFENKNIILVSGTNLGNFIPASGGSVIVNYTRSTPIAKYAQDDTSIALFGPKTKVIIDKSIKDPATALTIVQQEIKDSNPLNRVEADINGWYELIPSNTVTLSVPNLGLSVSGVSILQTSYKFDKNSVNSNNIISLSLSRKVTDLTDYIRSINKRLINLESSDASQFDVLTRIFSDKNQNQIVGSYWKWQTRSSLGSVFRFWSGTSPPKDTGGNILGLFYSGVGLTGSNSYLASGTTYNAYTTPASGGNSYAITGSYDPQASISGGGPAAQPGGIRFISFN